MHLKSKWRFSRALGLDSNHHLKFAFTPAAVPVNTSSNRISIGATREGQSVLVTVQLIFVAVSDFAGPLSMFLFLHSPSLHP